MSTDPSNNAQPAQAGDIEYKAFALEISDGVILYLLASCSYPFGQYQIFFEMDAKESAFKLMEIAPTYHDQLTTYYVASFTTGFPSQWGDQINIIDGHGSHLIAITPW